MTDPTPFPGSGTPRFHLRAGALFCEDVRVADLAAEHGTPLYVYSEGAMRDRFAAVRAAFGADARICYAVKANPNLAILRTFHAMGAGFDVVSGGELARVRAAGLPTHSVVFAGVGKSAREIDEGVAAGILAFHVEAEHELAMLEAAGSAAGRRVPIALRLNPDVQVDTHDYISTGKKENKFGLDPNAAAHIVRRIRRSATLELVGYHVHLGSQLRGAEPYGSALDRVEEFLDADPAHRDGVRYYDLGGGFGIAYGDDAGPCDVGAVAARLLPRLRARGLQPLVEPGRFLVGDAGVLITRVLGRKDGATKRFLIVDAAMNDLIRPALYGATHPVAAVEEPLRAPDGECDVVGPVCESGDFLARAAALPPMQGGDLLAVLAAGAYGASMASNYNSRPRPAEILVSGSRARLVRRRETYEDLWGPELLP